VIKQTGGAGSAACKSTENVIERRSLPHQKTVAQLNSRITADSWIEVPVAPRSSTGPFYVRVGDIDTDPDLFVASYFGFETVDEYREWVELWGAALCSERTRSGRLRRNTTGYTEDIDEWRARHRATPCRIHAGRRP
jgi:hypothetical protein